MQLAKFVENLLEVYTKIEKEFEKEEKWFKDLWRNNADMYSFYEFVNHIHKNVFGEELEPVEYEKRWQYFLLLHENYKQAKLECINLIMGWY